MHRDSIVLGGVRAESAVGGIEERLRDVIALADQHHLGRCRIGFVEPQSDGDPCHSRNI